MASPRVLVIDADRATIEGAREAIDKAGFDMEIALTPATALSILEQRHMDAIILDLELQELRSATVVREIRRVAAGAPLIGISAVAPDWEEKQAVREELTHWIERTSDPGWLSNELERVLPTSSVHK